MRMRRGRGFRCAPPWWPASEPWPPVGQTDASRRGRARFVRRIALLLGTLLLLSAIGASSLLSMVFGRWTGAPALSFAAPLIAWFAFSVLFVFGFRRIGSPVGDIVHAAQRVADGDYSTRVGAHGPRFVRSVGNAFNTMTARLEAQDKQRRDLMADIAHELRTPLTVIQGRLEGLLDGVYPRDDARLAEVLEETRMLARLIEDLRTLANADSGVLSLQKEPTDLPMLIRDVVTSLSSDAASRDVAVRVDAATDLPLVTFDPLRIREVLVNLLSNALRYTPVGGMISITATVSDEGTTVSVADNGPGIPADDLPKIFERFYKGRTSRGSGLGLTIARNLVTAHGGTIRADSEPGRGTRVTFTLPFE